jgi:hypothetical protein
MNRILSIAVMLLSVTVPIFAQTPEEITRAYFDKIKQHKWEETAPYFEKNSLKEFREAFDFLFAIPDKEAQKQAIAGLFGEEMTAEELKKLSDELFFSKIMKVMTTMGGMGQIEFDSLEIIGSVPESDSLIHILNRAQVKVGEITVKELDVTSFKKIDGQWKIILSGEMKGMAEQIKKAFEMR